MQLVEKFTPEAQDITSSVRDLPTVRFVSLGEFNLQRNSFFNFFSVVLRCFIIFTFLYRTAMGRARAWLRLALMQKKLADYLKVLIDHRDDVLRDYFEPDALIMCDEAIVIMGLLVGLNVIDCNLCVKVGWRNIPEFISNILLVNTHLRLFSQRRRTWIARKE